MSLHPGHLAPVELDEPDAARTAGPGLLPAWLRRHAPAVAGSSTSNGVTAPPARTGETSPAQTARGPSAEDVVVQRTQTAGNSERPPGGSAASSENGTDHRTSPVSGSVP